MRVKTLETSFHRFPSSCPLFLPRLPERCPSGLIFSSEIFDNMYDSFSKAKMTLHNLLNGEGNGTPLHYSCLENPMDGEAWKVQSMGLLKVGHD